MVGRHRRSQRVRWRSSVVGGIGHWSRGGGRAVSDRLAANQGSQILGRREALLLVSLSWFVGAPGAGCSAVSGSWAHAGVFRTRAHASVRLVLRQLLLRGHEWVDHHRCDHSVSDIRVGAATACCSGGPLRIGWAVLASSCCSSPSCPLLGVGGKRLFAHRDAPDRVVGRSSTPRIRRDGPCAVVSSTSGSPIAEVDRC